MAGSHIVYLEVDATELIGLLTYMKSCLTTEKFDLLMHRSMRELGQRSKKIIRTAIQKEYCAPNGFINSAIGNAVVGGGGGNVLCTIPITSEYGKIGSTYSAAGGHYGWNPPGYSVTSNIVKSGTSTLPASLPSYGGQPPFRNIGERTTTKRGKRKLKKPVVEKRGGLGGLTFTRKGKSRLPIVRVTGITVPQMPLTRSKAETENKLLELAEKRVIHNFSQIFG